MKLLILQGLPASGKTTFSKDLVKQGNWKRVNKDELREMMDNYVWSPENEKFVNKIRDNIIVKALQAGINVVVDDTNLNPKHEHNIREMLLMHPSPQVSSTEVDTKFFDTPIEECIKRDKERGEKGGRSVGAHVIRKMSGQLKDGKPRKDEMPISLPDKWYPTEGLPDCIIVDIDGTLSHMVDRSPYDWLKVGSDKVDDPVRRLIIQESSSAFVILLSGRDSVCRTITEKWLMENMVPHKELHMRPEGDSRKDSYVKAELFDEHIRGKYNVKYILDDRDQVVRMWRYMGLKVLQVADGDF